MKERTRKERPAAMHMRCDDIQSLLLDYINGELGEGRKDLVRDHMEKCAKCQETAQEMRLTIAILKTSRHKYGSVHHLSTNRHLRIIRALLHPVQEWMINHHIFISLVIALMIVILVWAVMSRGHIIHNDDPLEGAVPVNWHSEPANMDERPWIEKQ